MSKYVECQDGSVDARQNTIAKKFKVEDTLMRTILNTIILAPIVGVLFATEIIAFSFQQMPLPISVLGHNVSLKIG